MNEGLRVVFIIALLANLTLMTWLLTAGGGSC